MLFQESNEIDEIEGIQFRWAYYQLRIEFSFKTQGKLKKQNLRPFL